MVGTGLAQQFVAQDLAALFLHQLLQLRFAVLKARDRACPVQRREYLPLDKITRSFHPAVQVQRRDDRLDSIRQNGRAPPAARMFLAPAEPDVFAQAQLRRNLVQALLANELRPQPGHTALRQLRETPVQLIRHDHAQHRVSQKLQALVALAAAAAVLVSVGAVSKRRHQQSAVTEAVTQFFLQRIHQLPAAFST